MHIPGGVFFGYRELVLPGGGSSPSPPPLATLPSDFIKPWELSILPNLPYDYRSFQGRASDSFTDEFITIDEAIDFKSTAVEVDVRKSEANILYTVDGITAESLTIVSGHKVQIMSVRGYKIRCNVPGDDCYYQIIFYR